LRHRTLEKEAPLLAQAGRVLSGGEHLVLALGRAPMLEPRLILLDEPSQGLVSKVVAEMYEKLGEIHTSGTTIPLVEHNVTAALRYASRACVMERRRTALDGASEELRRNDDARRAYLGACTCTCLRAAKPRCR
jgi:branched-chain amino acid transport system ATP-binding protein